MTDRCVAITTTEYAVIMTNVCGLVLANCQRAATRTKLLRPHPRCHWIRAPIPGGGGGGGGPPGRVPPGGGGGGGGPPPG
jgi:hypothetical protein